MKLVSKLLVGLLLMIGTAGCSPALLSGVGSMLGLSGDKPALGIDAQIGAEANKQIIVGDQDRQDYEIDAKGDAIVTTNTTKTALAQEFMGTVGSVSVTNISPLYIIIMVLGWIAPTPGAMWRAVMNRVWILKKNRKKGKK